MKRSWAFGCAALSALGLAACASMPPAPPTPTAMTTGHTPFIRLADLTRHESAYMARHFSPAQLPPGVRTTVAYAGAVSLPFQRLVVTRQFVRHLTNRDVDVTRRVTDTLTNLGNGYLEDHEHLSVNSVSVSLDLGLSYVGFVGLERQHIDYRSALVRSPQRLQQLSSLTPDVAHPKPGATYTTTKRWLRRRTTVTCKADRRFYPARTLLAQLPGRALNLACSSSHDGIVEARSRLTYLTAYGIYLVMRRDTRTFTARGKLIRIVAHRHAPVARLIAPVPHAPVPRPGHL